MTLSTSATNNYKYIFRNYLIISGFCALFSAVYEYFSFGVYAAAMICVFLYPLLGGALPALVLYRLRFTPPQDAVWVWLYRCGLATLTVGSIVQGVLDIYGTENNLTVWYWFVGCGLCIINGILYIIHLFHARTNILEA